MILHPWHGLSPGAGAPEQVTAVIEIPKGSRIKYEIDKESGLIKMDRVLYAAMSFPLNYGFIPRSLGEDGDPLDIVVLTQAVVVPLCLIPCRVIGLMQMDDRGQVDDKIIAVALQDISVDFAHNIDQLPEYLRMELKHFFEQYKVLEGKTVKVEEFLGADAACRVIRESLERYTAAFPEG